MVKSSLGSSETILSSTLEAVSTGVVGSDVGVGINVEGYSSGGGGRGISNGIDCTPCVW